MRFPGARIPIPHDTTSKTIAGPTSVLNPLAHLIAARPLLPTPLLLPSRLYVDAGLLKLPGVGTPLLALQPQSRLRPGSVLTVRTSSTTVAHGTSSDSVLVLGIASMMQRTSGKTPPANGR